MPTKKEEKPPAPTPEAKEEPKEEPISEPAKTYTQAEYDAAMKRAQKDSDKKIADAEAKAKLDETERAKAELEDAKSALRERDARDAVKDAAAKAGVKNPDLFYKAVRSDLEFDDSGNLKNLKDVLESSKTEMPELYGATTAAKPTPEGSADGGDGKNAPAALTKEAIEKMSDTEIAANMDAIDAFMASSAS